MNVAIKKISLIDQLTRTHNLSAWDFLGKGGAIGKGDSRLTF